MGATGTCLAQGAAGTCLAQGAGRDVGTEPVKGVTVTCLPVCLGACLGAAPSLVWASGAFFAAAFVILIPIAVWIYTLVFIFSALWFVHFLLLALSKLREEPIIIPNEAQP
jgi:hypothetical protein